MMKARDRIANVVGNLASAANAALCVRALISSVFTCVYTTHQLYHVHRVVNVQSDVR